MLKQKKPVLIGLMVIALAITGWLFFRFVTKELALTSLDRKIPTDSISRLWYKSAIIYTLDVKVFKDSDGDGNGDFNGLTQKIDYIDSLGANVILLPPFQPTPDLDEGYTITDYRAIDKRLGTLNDFKAFITAASKRNIRVIMDLVINHTSDKHTWFKQSRIHKLSSYRNWYIWSKEKPVTVTKGVHQGSWTYDSLANEYYYHHYSNLQPDLNMQNPMVRAEIKKIVNYWIGFGLSGFKIDAVPFIDVPKTKGEKSSHQFEIISQLRNYIQSLKDDVIILGEANVLPEETKSYFGVSGNVMQMIFNSYVNQFLFYSLATGEVKPLKQALEATDKIPPTAEWAQFLRNDAELNVAQLNRRQRNDVYGKFGPDKILQLNEKGIRRRLAPMMNNDRKLIELAYSTLFSLPGTPVIRYGDEIGMGDNLALKDHNSVITPMQWNSDTTAGFASTGKSMIPVIDSGRYSYRKINVELASKKSNSLLNWTRLAIKVHKQCPEISFGSRKYLETRNSHILAIRYEWKGNKLLVIHNFSKESQKISLNTRDAGGSKLKNLFSSGENLKTGKKNIHVGLEGYGYRWYKVAP